MSLQTLKEQKGFTIVELLIVIVVIGILAAITIVAFNGIQNRANNTAAQSVADSIAKKAESWNAIQSSYPTFEQLKTNSLAPTGTGDAAVAAGGAGPVESKLDNTASILSATVDASNGKASVKYAQCNSGEGAKIAYYQWTGTNPTIKSLGNVASCADPTL